MENNVCFRTVLKLLGAGEYSNRLDQKEIKRVGSHMKEKAKKIYIALIIIIIILINECVCFAGVVITFVIAVEVFGIATIYVVAFFSEYRLNSGDSSN